MYICCISKTVFIHTCTYTHCSYILCSNEMLKQTVSEVVATNCRMVCCKLLQVSADGLCFHEEYRALQLITKNIYHKKPAKLPFSFVEVSLSNTYNNIMYACSVCVCVYVCMRVYCVCT